MTRTDAINILKNEKPHCGRKIRYTEGDICEAFDMAINSLEMATNSLEVDEMYQLEKEDADEFISKKEIEDIKAELNEISEETISRADIDAIKRCLKVIDKYISGKDQNENSN